MRDTNQDHQEAINALQLLTDNVVAEYKDLGVHIEPDEAQEITESKIKMEKQNRSLTNSGFPKR
jgi:hypothetical protein